MSEDMCIYELLLRLPGGNCLQDQEVILGAITSPDPESQSLLSALGMLAAGRSWAAVELRHGVAVLDGLSRGYCRRLGVV